MRKIAYIILLLCFCTGMSAADTNKQATKILDKAAAKINIKKGAIMNFSISGGRINQSGTLKVKSNKFMASTPNASIWFDGTTQWMLNKKSDEVNVSSPSASKQAGMNPYAFLTLYKQGYTKSVETTASGYNVHLVGKGKGISEMYVLVDKSYNLKQVKMKQGNSWTTITVSGIRNANLADGVFRYNHKDHPKAEIIDLR